MKIFLLLKKRDIDFDNKTVFIPKISKLIFDKAYEISIPWNHTNHLAACSKFPSFVSWCAHRVYRSSRTGSIGDRRTLARAMASLLQKMSLVNITSNCAIKGKSGWKCNQKNPHSNLGQLGCIIEIKKM